MEAVRLTSEELAEQQKRVTEQAKQSLLLPHFPLQLDQATSPQRQQVEQFIAKRFKAAYNAELAYFMQYLLSIHTDTNVCGALGFQPAAEVEPLFLETYLQEPVEQTLSSVTKQAVDRRSIVEVGNLASYKQRATQTLFVLLADMLKRSGYDWVVFTANKSVLTWVQNLGLPYIPLGEADPSLLEDKGASWGSYYDDKPTVLACHIKPGFEQMTSNRLINFLRQSYDSKIAEFSEGLKRV